MARVFVAHEQEGQRLQDEENCDELAASIADVVREDVVEHKE